METELNYKNYGFLEIAMQPILQSTQIQGNKYNKDDYSNWNSILEAEIHEPLDLAG